MSRSREETETRVARELGPEATVVTLLRDSGLKYLERGPLTAVRSSPEATRGLRVR